MDVWLALIALGALLMLVLPVILHFTWRRSGIRSQKFLDSLQSFIENSAGILIIAGFIITLLGLNNYGGLRRPDLKIENAYLPTGSTAMIADATLPDGRHAKINQGEYYVYETGNKLLDLLTVAGWLLCTVPCLLLILLERMKSLKKSKPQVDAPSDTVIDEQQTATG